MATFCSHAGDYFFLKFFIPDTIKIIFMILTVEVMKKFLDHVPDDYEISFEGNGIEHLVQDKILVDVENKKIVLKS